MSENRTPAGFWLRAGALIIDFTILLIANLLIQGLRFTDLPEILVGLLTFALPLYYFAIYPIDRSGQTPGKAVAGIGVVSTRGRYHAGWALLRWFGYMLSGTLAGLGFIAAALTRERITLHDLIAGTRVVVIEEISALRRNLVLALGAAPVVLLCLSALASLWLPSIGRGPAGGIPLTRTSGDLLHLRSSKAEYYAKERGFPRRLEDIVPKYLSEIPEAMTGHHPPSSDIEVYGGEVCTGSEIPGETIDGERLRDTGRWGYVNDKNAVCKGLVFIDCRHPARPGGLAWHRH